MVLKALPSPPVCACHAPLSNQLIVIERNTNGAVSWHGNCISTNGEHTKPIV